MEREKSTLPVDEVFGRIFEIEEEINSLRKVDGTRDRVRNLYLEKGYNAFLLLKARHERLIALRVGVMMNPDDTPHTYSQYKVEIEVPRGLNTTRGGFRVGTDLISPMLNDDSRNVLKLIDNPDYTISEHPESMINRTYDEIREIQRTHTSLRRKGSFDDLAALDSLRLNLIEKILKAKNQKLTSRIITKRYRGQRELMVLISFSKVNYIALPFSDEIDGLFRKYGGYDKDELK